MALRYYANAPATTLSASCTAVATSIQVTSVAGLPISYPYTLILDRGTSTEEAVSVTAAAGTTLTVTRGIDSTTAFSHSAGAAVVHGITAQDVREPNTHINNNSGVHGVTGSVVGTSDSQTLTNKTVSADNNTISGVAASSFVLSNASGNVDGSAAQKAIPSGVVVGTTDAQTLTNKTLALGSNTVSGTLAQLNAAVTDADVATLAGTETLTNKTISNANNTINGFSANALVKTDGTGKLVSGDLDPGGGQLVVWTGEAQSLTNKTLGSGTKVSPGTTDISAGWVTYTPTFTNLTVGDATLSVRYLQIGKTIFYRGKITFGSGTSVSGTIQISLPVNSAWSAFGDPFAGAVTLFDNSGSARRFWTPAQNSVTAFYIADDSDARANATVPWSWATSDSIAWNFTYEAA